MTRDYKTITEKADEMKKGGVDSSKAWHDAWWDSHQNAIAMSIKINRQLFNSYCTLFGHINMDDMSLEYLKKVSRFINDSCYSDSYDDKGKTIDWCQIDDAISCFIKENFSYLSTVEVREDSQGLGVKKDVEPVASDYFELIKSVYGEATLSSNMIWLNCLKEPYSSKYKVGIINNEIVCSRGSASVDLKMIIQDSLSDLGIGFKPVNFDRTHGYKIRTKDISNWFKNHQEEVKPIEILDELKDEDDN